MVVTLRNAESAETAVLRSSGLDDAACSTTSPWPEEDVIVWVLSQAIPDVRGRDVMVFVRHAKVREDIRHGHDWRHW